MQFRGRFIVCSQRASCALYELEEVGLRGGALMQWPYQRLTLNLLSAITNCACPGPNGGRVGIYWGGGDTPYIGSPLLLLEPPKPFTDILALSAFLALMGYSRAGGQGWGVILLIWVRRLFSCDPQRRHPSQMGGICQKVCLQEIIGSREGALQDQWFISYVE